MSTPFPRLSNYADIAAPDRNEYLARALDCLADANRSTDPSARALLVKISTVYVNLIKMVDHNANTDLFGYEALPPSRLQ